MTCDADAIAQQASCDTPQPERGGGGGSSQRAGVTQAAPSRHDTKKSAHPREQLQQEERLLVRRRGAGLPRVIRLAAGCELVHLENRAFSAVRQHADCDPTSCAA